MVKKVVLDPGHGGADHGASGNGLREKDLTLAISLATERILLNEYKDVAVYMTRRKDVGLTLAQRSSYSNSVKPHLFVSVHINSASATAHGYESFVSPYSGSKTKLKAVHNAVASYFYNKHLVRDRGYKQMAFYVLKNTHAPAILTESLFISNPKEATILRNNVEGIARAHAEGIANYLGLAKKQNTVDKGELTMSQYKELKQEIAKLRGEVNANELLTKTSKDDLKLLFKFAKDEGLFTEDHSVRVDNMKKSEATDRMYSLLGRLAKNGYLTKN